MADAELSKKLGKNDGWAHDYLRAKQPSPRKLPLELALEIARVLTLTHGEVGAIEPLPVVTTPTGFSDSNAESWTPPTGHFLMASASITYQRMVDSSLDQDERRIRAGSILAFRTGQVRTPDIKIGDIVWCQSVDRDDPLRSLGSVIGLWIPPNKVASNSSGANWIYSIDDAEQKRQLIVRGVMMGVVDVSPGHAAGQPSVPSHRPTAHR